MKILVTGAGGFIATNFIIEALKQGHEIIGIDNFSRNGSGKNARFLTEKYTVPIFSMDIRNKFEWENLEKVDAVVHYAGQPGIPKSLEEPVFDFQTNALGTLYGLEYARSCGDIPFLYASTNKIYSDEVNDLPILELEKRYSWGINPGVSEIFPMDSAGRHPHSPYGVSKASGDLLCQEYFHAFEVPTVVMRMSCIYGLHQNGVSEQGWTDFFIRQRILGDNKLTFFGNGKQVRDCLFGEDCAKAYLLALEKIDKSAGKVFNLGGGKFNSSLIEWVDILNTYTNKPPMKIEYDEWRLADHRIYISDTSKIEHALGWKAEVDIPTGIDRMIKAYETK